MDIINKRNELTEYITLSNCIQIQRPMFSLLNALQSLRGKFDFINTYDINIELYIKLQEAILKELFQTDLTSLQIALESNGYDIQDFIEKTVPFEFKNVKRFIQLEILHAIDEFTRYLHPEVTEYLDGLQNTIKFKGKTPSEKYTESMEAYTSFMGSPDLTQEMITTLNVFTDTDSLLDNASFIPAIKSKRYSQISDDIRYIVPEIIPKKEFKLYEPDQIVLYKRKVKSKSYYTSNGIFPLIWAEIKYAIENDIFSRQCNCGKYFELKKHNMMKKNCSNKCRDEQRKKNDMLNPNYDEIVRLKKRKSRVESQEKKDEIQKEIDKLKEY